MKPRSFAAAPAIDSQPRYRASQSDLAKAGAIVQLERTQKLLSMIVAPVTVIFATTMNPSQNVTGCLRLDSFCNHVLFAIP